MFQVLCNCCLRAGCHASALHIMQCSVCWVPRQGHMTYGFWPLSGENELLHESVISSSTISHSPGQGPSPLALGRAPVPPAMLAGRVAATAACWKAMMSSSCCRASPWGSAIVRVADTWRRCWQVSTAAQRQHGWGRSNPSMDNQTLQTMPKMGSVRQG